MYSTARIFSLLKNRPQNVMLPAVSFADIYTSRIIILNNRNKKDAEVSRHDLPSCCLSNQDKPIIYTENPTFCN